MKLQPQTVPAQQVECHIVPDNTTRLWVAGQWVPRYQYDTILKGEGTQRGCSQIGCCAKSQHVPRSMHATVTDLGRGSLLSVTTSRQMYVQHHGCPHNYTSASTNTRDHEDHTTTGFWLWRLITSKCAEWIKGHLSTDGSQLDREMHTTGHPRWHQWLATEDGALLGKGRNVRITL